MSTTFSRTITNELHSLESLMHAITNFLEDNGVDAPAVYRINLAMEEMITNVIKYGYTDYETHDIDITVDILEEQIVAVIEERGKPFNPLEAKPAPEPGSVEESQVGGLGIHLIRKMLDTLDYRRDAGKNVLEIRARRNAPAAGA